jgi:hypothetical protein
MRFEKRLIAEHMATVLYATTAGNGYLVVSSSISFEQGKTEVWVIRLDADGVIIWHHTPDLKGQAVSLDTFSVWSMAFFCVKLFGSNSRFEDICL